MSEKTKTIIGSGLSGPLLAIFLSQRDYNVQLYEKRLEREIRKNPVPNHLAVIMDGNRRYAESVGILPFEGHAMGRGTLENLSNWCRNLDIKFLTVYAFSLENFNRDKNELEPLMDLFE